MLDAVAENKTAGMELLEKSCSNPALKFACSVCFVLFCVLCTCCFCLCFVFCFCFLSVSFLFCFVLFVVDCFVCGCALSTNETTRKTTQTHKNHRTQTQTQPHPNAERPRHEPSVVPIFHHTRAHHAHTHVLTHAHTHTHTTQTQEHTSFVGCLSKLYEQPIGRTRFVLLFVYVLGCICVVVCSWHFAGWRQNQHVGMRVFACTSANAQAHILRAHSHAHAIMHLMY